MSQSVQLTPRFYLNSSPMDLSALGTASQSPEEQIAAFKINAESRADHLPVNEQSAYRNQMRQFVSALYTQISYMNTLNLDAQEIQFQISKTIGEYNRSLTDLYRNNAQYDDGRLQVEEQNRAIAQQLQATNVHLTAFTPKGRRGPTVREVLSRTPTTTPRITRTRLTQSLANMDMHDHLLDVSITARIAEATGEAVVKLAKASCKVTQTTEKVCRSTRDLAGKAGIAVLEFTNTKELVKDAIRYWQSCEGSNLADVLVERYGFAPDQAKQIAKQYVKDVSTVATGVGVSGTTSAVVKIVKPLVKPLLGRATVAISNQSPRIPLSGPSPGFQAFVEAENKIQQKLAQFYRNFLINANRHPKVPYLEVPKHPDVYFHATSLEKAYGILKSGSILRLDRGHFFGAFVSTHPEWLLGDILFVFNRSIEKASKVLNAQFNGKRHWAGFSDSIPVTTNTLEYIAVEADLLAEKPIEEIAKQLYAAAGREIPVVPLDPIIEIIEKRVLQEGVFVPDEWPLCMEFQRK